jgi:hypothetical protein
LMASLLHRAASRLPMSCTGATASRRLATLAGSGDEANGRPSLKLPLPREVQA